MRLRGLKSNSTATYAKKKYSKYYKFIDSFVQCFRVSWGNQGTDCGRKTVDFDAWQGLFWVFTAETAKDSLLAPRGTFKPPSPVATGFERHNVVIFISL